MARLFSAAPVCRRTPGRQGNSLPKQLFDRAPLKIIFGGDETGRLTGRIHTSRSANPMDVVLGTIGQIEIDDMSDIRHIDATRRDIRRDENAERPTLKPF
jgi:hypothetical protein